MTPGVRRTTIALVATVFGMTGLSFAAKPLYDTFCRVTGFGGTTQVADAPLKGDLGRAIRVRFDANVAPGAPLEFKPEQGHMDIRLGETAMGFYAVTNTADYPVRVVAGYNVAPHKAGIYFNKVECFCFKERTLGPGESDRLPVVYFVDPELAKDRQIGDVQAVTLSYTYYLAGDAPASPSESAALAPRREDASAVN
jgi:cytochrome c oxidase assembly protein subunit 11